MTDLSDFLKDADAPSSWSDIAFVVMLLAVLGLSIYGFVYCLEWISNFMIEIKP